MKRAYIELTAEAFRIGLTLPESIIVGAVQKNENTQVYRVYLYGGNLPDIVELGNSPQVNIEDIK